MQKGKKTAKEKEAISEAIRKAIKIMQDAGCKNVFVCTNTDIMNPDGFGSAFGRDCNGPFMMSVAEEVHEILNKNFGMDKLKGKLAELSEIGQKLHEISGMTSQAKPTVH